MRVSSCLALLTAVVVCAGFAAPAALAAKSTERFIETGSSPGGIAVNDSTGDVYVQNASADRIQRYDSTGALVGQFGATGTGAGELSFGGLVAGLAIDQADGALYVADVANHRVQKLAADGTFVAMWGDGVNQTTSGDVCMAASGDTCGAGSPGSGEGEFSSPQAVAVDPSTANVYVADTANARIQRLSPAGAFQTQFAVEMLPAQIDIDSTGRVYVSDGGASPVTRYTSGGDFDFQLTGTSDNLIIPHTSFTVDSTTDNVYVSGQRIFSNPAIYEVTPDGTIVDTHRPGILFAALGGQGDGDPLYASDSTAGRVEVLTDAGSPASSASIEPVDDIATTSATFHGTVNPNGSLPSDWRFEYSTDDGSTWVATAGGTVAAGSTDVPVEEAVTGLEPSLEHRVRLVASKASFGGPETTSDETTFTTDGAPPLVRALEAGTRTATAARLGARINPQNSPTTYYVEYTLATDAAYANSTRVPQAPDTAEAGGGGNFTPVSQLIVGLEPDTTYRFRVVAANETGPTQGADRIFTTRVALPEPPPGRGYEMVSPLDKNGGNLDRDILIQEWATSGAAEGGDAVAYPVLAQFANPAAGASASQYLARRTGTGWVTQNISPPVEAEVHAPIDTTVPLVPYLAADLTKAVMVTNFPLTEGARGLLGGSHGLYLWNGLTGTYQLLSDPWTSLPTDASGYPWSRFVFEGASEDMAHIVFSSWSRQLTEDGLPTDESFEAVPSLYQWSNGELEFVSVLPDGQGVPAAPGARSSVPRGQSFPGDHFISNDGSRMFFTFYGNSGLYVRQDGERTEAVSASERLGDDPTTPVPGTFLAAEANHGRRALFSSGSPLTAGANTVSGSEDLYLWDETQPSGARLKNLTDASANGAGVLGLAAASKDLTHAYFVATAALAADAQEGAPNLYEWRDGQSLRLVGTLLPEDGGVWSTQRNGSFGTRYRDARTTADGSRLVFGSRAQLTEYDNAGSKQVYFFDSDNGELTCVSCDPGGSAPTGDAGLFPMDVAIEATAPYRLTRNLSADGSTVIFETEHGLLPRDSNGLADVYRWRDDEVSLITSGQGSSGSQFVDASADGKDVFFTTRERLVGMDTDNQVDLYDARVGGGFAEQEVPPSCEGDACQGPPTRSPDLPMPRLGSNAGDASPPKRASLAMRRLSQGQRRALARGARAVLVARVDRPGRVTVRGVARVGRRARTVLGATKRARRAGAVRVPVRLSRIGRIQLARSGRLRISLRVRSTGVAEARSISVLLVSTSTGKGR